MFSLVCPANLMSVLLNHVRALAETVIGPNNTHSLEYWPPDAF